MEVMMAGEEVRGGERRSSGRRAAARRPRTNCPRAGDGAMPDMMHEYPRSLQ